MAGIFWLASYPKSGNTWMRMFLSNLTGEHEKPVDINAQHGHEIASSRLWLDHVLAFESGDLTANEVEALRPACHAWASGETKETEFHKIHDANIAGSAGAPLIRPGSCRGALYIVRNPLDVVASAASHWGVSIHEAIARMNRPNASMADRVMPFNKQVRQRTLDWSSHARSWVDAAELAIHVVRYEDLLADPMTHFGAAARFLDLPVDDVKLMRAIDGSRFEELSRQEESSGFKEKSYKAGRFFRSGRAGGWRDELDPAQVMSIVQSHSATMRRFGYLDAEDRPL